MRRTRSFFLARRHLWNATSLAEKRMIGVPCTTGLTPLFDVPFPCVEDLNSVRWQALWVTRDSVANANRTTNPRLTS